MPASPRVGDCLDFRPTVSRLHTECDDGPSARSHLTHPKRLHFRITSFHRVAHTLGTAGSGINRINWGYKDFGEPYVSCVTFQLNDLTCISMRGGVLQGVRDECFQE